VLKFFCIQTKYSKYTTDVNSHYVAEGVVRLLNSHNQEIKLDYIFEILKQSASEETKKPELELKHRTLTVSKWTQTN
jgi:hypothetical protein